MTYVILFIIISIISGFLLTYFLDAKSSSKNLQSPISSRQSSINAPRPLSIHPSQEGIQFSIPERLAYGVVIGLGLFTWLVYLFSLIFGLQFKSILISALLLIVFCLLFLKSKWNTLKIIILNEALGIKDDFLRNKLSYFVHIVVFAFFATIFLRLFYRIIIWHDGAMFVGLPNNYGDLPLHLAYITSFAWGDNIPPIDPLFANEKLVYPILSDFLSAILLKLGLGFKEILLIPGVLLTTAFYGVLYYFVYRLTKKRVAAIVAEFIFFFAGGFGFYYFFQDLVDTSKGFWWFLTDLPGDYTKIPSLNYHWITPLTCLNVPQRPFLFGFPITIMVFTLLYIGIERNRQKPVGNWQLAVGKKQKAVINWQSAVGKRQKVESIEWKEFLFAGVLAGSLPFFHTHSFLAVIIVTIPLAIIFWDWRRWLLFFCPAFILSLPQVVCFAGHVGEGSFFRYNFGWMAGDENFLWFWLKNTGLFWLVYIGGLVTLCNSLIPPFNTPLCPSLIGGIKGGLERIRSAQRIFAYFTLPFLILFFLPNIMLFAPWNWDNIKILIYWFLGSLPLAALALTLLYENKKYKLFFRAAFFLIMFSLTISGGIDVFKYAVAPIEGLKEFSYEEMELARRISANTEPNAIFLNAPVHNHPVFLSGRKSLMGYPGHIWSHGYKDAGSREKDIRKMLKGEVGLRQIEGEPKRISLIEKYKPDYAIIGPHERRLGVNKKYFDIRYKRIMTSAHYYIYDLNKKLQSDAILVDK